MPEQISKIDSIPSVLLKPVSAGTGSRVLPALNTLVDIKILEVLQNNVRMLIGGRVFVSKFPGLVQREQNFIARVINLNPFTLSLNLVGIKGALSDAEILLLLTKLNLPDNPVSRKVIRSLIAEKKPLEKSRLGELIDHLEKKGIDPDEQQLMILIRASGNSDFKEFINEADDWIFKNSIEEVAGDIFNSVRFLMSSALPAEITEAVENALILDPDKAQELGGYILSKRGIQFENLVRVLASVKAESLADVSVQKEFIKLKESISRYRILQKIYSDAGIYTGILIIKKNYDYELIQYGFQKQENKEDKVFKIKIDLAPENLGEIKINTFVGTENLMVDFQTSQKTIDYMRTTEKDFSKLLRDKLMLTPFIKFSPLKPGTVKFKSSEAVNVKI